MTTDYEEPTVVVTVRHNGSIRWFRGHRDLWVLDVNKWRDEFLAAGYDVPMFTDDYRFGIHSVDDTNTEDFLAHMADYEVTRDALSYELVTRYVSAQTLWDVVDLFPIMFVDFDRKKVAGFYRDGAAMERYLPDGWQGEFTNFLQDFPDEVFPVGEKFWIKGDSDLLELLLERSGAYPDDDPQTTVKDLWIAERERRRRTTQVELHIENVFDLSDGRTVVVVADSEQIYEPIGRSRWQLWSAGSDMPIAFIQVRAELLKRGPQGQRVLEIIGPPSFERSDIESTRCTLVLETQ